MWEGIVLIMNAVTLQMDVDRQGYYCRRFCIDRLYRSTMVRTAGIDAHVWQRLLPKLNNRYAELEPSVSLLTFALWEQCIRFDI